MPLDADAIAARLPRRGGEDRAPALPRRDRALPQAAAAGGEPITVGCTQEAPLFSEVARRAAPASCLSSMCARPPAGRPTPRQAGPKMAALLAAAAEPLPDIPFVSLDSEGVVLIYGRDESAIEAAQAAGRSSRRHRADRARRTASRRRASPNFRWCKGTIKSAKGHLGAFEIVVDDYAQPAPSSRGALVVRPVARRRGVALRSRARSVRRRAAVLRRRSARRLSARRSGRSRRGAARRAEGARSHRHVRQAALHHLHRGSLRAFALARSSAATAASISARPARSRRPAITSRSMRKSAPAAANAPRPARPAPPPTRCRRPMR